MRTAEPAIAIVNLEGFLYWGLRRRARDKMCPWPGAQDAGFTQLRWPPAEGAGSGVRDVTRDQGDRLLKGSRQARWVLSANYFAKNLPL
jgi:hypothetical protein